MNSYCVRLKPTILENLEKLDLELIAVYDVCEMQHLRLYALWLDLELIAVLLYVTSQRGSLSFSNSFKRLLFLFSQPSRLAFPGLPTLFISSILVLMHVFFVGILFPQMASPCGGGGLWPPTTWYRFAYSLSPAIPSLPPSGLRSPASLRRRPSPCERIHLSQGSGSSVLCDFRNQ